MNLRKWAIGLLSTALLSAPITTALAEEADTTSGASQTSEWYADPTTLKDSYDIVEGWQQQLLHKKQVLMSQSLRKCRLLVGIPLNLQEG